MQTDDDNKKNGSNVGAVIGGAVVGAAVAGAAALLLAPQSGKETREDIANKAKETGEDISKKMEGVKSKAEELVKGLPQTREEFEALISTQLDEINKRYEELIASDAGKSIKKELENARNVVAENLNNVRNAADDTLEDAKHKFDESVSNFNKMSENNK